MQGRPEDNGLTSWSGCVKDTQFSCLSNPFDGGHGHAVLEQNRSGSIHDLGVPLQSLPLSSFLQSHVARSYLLNKKLVFY